MAKGILGWVGLLLVLRVSGQAVLYKDAVYPRVEVQRDLLYGQKGLLLDLYVPAGDSARSGPAGAGRPLIIWMHGGGFAFGSKSAKGIRLWCREFAQRGYCCAAINYRKRGVKALWRFRELVAGCADAVEDTRVAIAWLKKQAGVLGIDTNRIVLAGNSAGGMIALQAAYARMEELRGLAEGKAVAGEVGAPERVAAVVNFWGAIYDTRWLANARIPIVSVVGLRDRIVMPGRKNYFAGSVAIHESADSLGISNRLKTYAGYSHELQKHFQPFWAGRAAVRRWREAGQFAADFLAETVTGQF